MLLIIFVLSWPALEYPWGKQMCLEIPVPATIEYFI